MKNKILIKFRNQNNILPDPFYNDNQSFTNIKIFLFY